MGLATTCGHDQGDAILYSALQKEFGIMNCKTSPCGDTSKSYVSQSCISASIDDLC